MHMASVRERKKQKKREARQSSTLHSHIESDVAFNIVLLNRNAQSNDREQAGGMNL